MCVAASSWLLSVWVGRAKRGFGARLTTWQLPLLHLMVQPSLGDAEGHPEDSTFEVSLSSPNSRLRHEVEEQQRPFAPKIYCTVL